MQILLGLMLNSSIMIINLIHIFSFPQLSICHTLKVAIYFKEQKSLHYAEKDDQNNKKITSKQLYYLFK